MTSPSASTSTADLKLEPDAMPADPPRGAMPRSAATLALYALGFTLAHQLAAWWAGIGFYSLWFPAAGLRLAFLWRFGARWTVPLALAELTVDLALGAVPLVGRDAAIGWLGVVRPVIAYGAVVWGVRRVMRARARPAGARDVLFADPPMPFALACVAAPLLAACAALPQALMRGDLTGVADAREVALSLAAFTTGDLLGTLLLAPPLLWAAERATATASLTSMRRSPPAIADVAEIAVALALGVALGEVFAWLGLGAQPAPALLAVAWIGLRFGRVAAWGAMVVMCVLVLPRTAGGMPTAERMQFHLGLASIVAAGYLAGSFSDAQAIAGAEVGRRDRLLFQAERLKTLRAMSVAVIHEVSQPLSTLAIEARHLHELTVDAPTEVAATAALIDRKAAHLSELVRRLRRYGGRAVDEPSPLPLSTLIEGVIAMARPLAKAAGATVTVVPIDPNLVVLVQEVELTQAVLNLVGNALRAGGAGGRVNLKAWRRGELAVVEISNRRARRLTAHAGMGVGVLVARAIVEAHGGALAQRRDGDLVTATMSLPLVGVEE